MKFILFEVQEKMIKNVFILLTFFISLLFLVERRRTLQILLNIAPYAKVNPSVNIHVPNPQATGKVDGLTKLPSNPTIRYIKL